MKKAVYFLLFCIVGSIYSCREDEGSTKPDIKDKHTPRYKRSIISFREMKSKLSENSGQSVYLFNSIENREGDSYIQAIDSTYIIQYTNDTLTTYTLRVSTLDDKNYSYSNLIIKTLNGETKEFIAHYIPTSEWQMAHDKGDYLTYDGQLELTDTQGNPQERLQFCYFTLESTHIECYGSMCPCTDGNGTTNYSITLVCNGDTGGGGGDSGDYGGWNPEGGGGSGGNSGSGNGDLPTDPWNGLL